jgi:hypothetical protein
MTKRLSPPKEPAPEAIKAAVVRHTGHMAFLLSRLIPPDHRAVT